jgi:hypothetical protein
VVIAATVLDEAGSCGFIPQVAVCGPALSRVERDGRQRTHIAGVDDNNASQTA